MPKPDLNPINLGSIARGAAIELFEGAIAKIVDNISDTATEATAGRKITLKFKFKPDEDRRAVIVVTTASCKLAAVAEHHSKVYLGKDDSGHSYAFEQDPRQDLLFQPPDAKKSLLDFKAPSQA